VPMVRVRVKRFWSVELAVDMRPPRKLTNVDVATQVFSVTNGKGAEALKRVQSTVARQPKTAAEAVLQVTAPAAYVRPVEKVVVAAPYTTPAEFTASPVPMMVGMVMAPRFTVWKVEEAVDITPPPKFTRVEVETPE
jgi:hypothetical protein